MIYPLIARVIEREGGYVNHPADRGGPTNMGITQRTLADWRQAHGQGYPTEQDVAALTRDEAMEIYYHNYWKAPGFFTLQRDGLIEDMVFDAAVHHGPATAVRFLQRIARVEADGVLGPITREALNKVPDLMLAAGFLAERISFMGALISADPSQAVFAHGWLRRVTSFLPLFPQLQRGHPHA